MISDEIYHRLAYAAPDATALAYGSDVTVINSFSKYYCMTGWRIGWMVLPETTGAAGRADRRRASTFQRRNCRRSRRSRRSRQPEELEAVKARYALEPRTPDAAPARTRLCAGRADGRRVLRLLRCLQAHQRQHGVSPARCWPRRMSRRRPAAISIRLPGTATCAFPMPAATTTWSRRWTRIERWLK